MLSCSDHIVVALSTLQHVSIHGRVCGYITGLCISEPGPRGLYEGWEVEHLYTDTSQIAIIVGD